MLLEMEMAATAITGRHRELARKIELANEPI